MNYIGALAIDGKKFDYKTNERLQKALELKLFEDQKDTIKLTSLVSNVVDKATQEKIDVVKSRLIRNYGYNESSATDVLTFVASIFARGHTQTGARRVGRRWAIQRGGFSAAEEAMIWAAVAALQGAGYDTSPMQMLIRGDLPAGYRAMSLDDGAALGQEAFSSQPMLTHVLEEELLHLEQKARESGRPFGPGTAQALEAEVDEARKFSLPDERSDASGGSVAGGDGGPT